MMTTMIMMMTSTEGNHVRIHASNATLLRVRTATYIAVGSNRRVLHGCHKLDSEIRQIWNVIGFEISPRDCLAERCIR